MSAIYAKIEFRESNCLFIKVLGLSIFVRDLFSWIGSPREIRKIKYSAKLSTISTVKWLFSCPDILMLWTNLLTSSIDIKYTHIPIIFLQVVKFAVWHWFAKLLKITTFTVNEGRSRPFLYLTIIMIAIAIFLTDLENVAPYHSEEMGSVSEKFHSWLRWLLRLVLLCSDNWGWSHRCLDCRIHWHHLEEG